MPNDPALRSKTPDALRCLSRSPKVLESCRVIGGHFLEDHKKAGESVADLAEMAERGSDKVPISPRPCRNLVR